ncbi:DUF159 family protein [Burkholderia ambifaria]|uniref:SOS response-associated peptidase family protein n=1 Tax=Burkholderia ambifaria TaxID=152480 RepID=UPI000CFFC7FA|nr:SOS response-associated peptidase family protein [Burkholderia ambifaria]PRF99683.1 DUF159 family protein [Burkholderia ambifaria]
MCTNYVAPGEDPGLSELKIDNFRDLYRWTPWKPEIYLDYDAPIVGYVDGQFKPLIAGFGFWPHDLQKAKREEDKKAGRPIRKFLHTMNARDDNLGESKLYGPAWRKGARCLIPADYIIEPSYPDARQDDDGKWILGPGIWQKISVVDRQTMCVAGIWRTLTNKDGTKRHAMSMITVNADEHPIMSRMHKPGEEKRSVVILHPDDWEEWLTTPNAEFARNMLYLYPANDLDVERK